MKHKSTMRAIWLLGALLLLPGTLLEAASQYRRLEQQAKTPAIQLVQNHIDAVNEIKRQIDATAKRASESKKKLDPAKILSVQILLQEDFKRISKNILALKKGLMGPDATIKSSEKEDIYVKSMLFILRYLYAAFYLAANKFSTECKFDIVDQNKENMVLRCKQTIEELGDLNVLLLVAAEAAGFFYDEKTHLVVPLTRPEFCSHKEVQEHVTLLCTIAKDIEQCRTMRVIESGEAMNASKDISRKIKEVQGKLFNDTTAHEDALYRAKMRTVIDDLCARFSLAILAAVASNGYDWKPGLYEALACKGYVLDEKSGHILTKQEYKERQAAKTDVRSSSSSSSSSSISR